MVDQDKAAGIFDLIKLIDVVEVYCYSFMPAVDNQVEACIFATFFIREAFNELNRARVVSNRPEAHCSVAFLHAHRCIVLHNLILHYRQLLRHFHRLTLMVQHVAAHLLDDELAALNIFLGSLADICQSLDFGLLLVGDSLESVLLLDEFVARIANFLQLFLGFQELLFVQLCHFSFLLVRCLHFVLNRSFLLASGNFELFQFVLAVFKLALEHFLQVRNLLLASLDRGFQVGDRLKPPLRSSLVLDESRLQRIILFLRHNSALLFLRS